MAKAQIYIIAKATNEMRALEETGYLAEVVLQELLARYPELLAGDQIDPENPRRWLLVTREMGVPGAETESGRWSLDHLFIDQDGIPTFVECKRAEDTRLRREVVAQMLDYAANGVEYWNIQRIRETAALTAEHSGQSLAEAVRILIGDPEADVDAFWGLVEENLKNRKVRLIFVADQTPRELRRMVEFLNDEFKNVEVLIVEIKQYEDPSRPGDKALVSRVIGLSETARTARSTSPRSLTNRSEFLSRCSPAGRRFFEDLFERAHEMNFILRWGTKGVSVRYAHSKQGQLVTYLHGFPEDLLEFYFDPKGPLDRGKDSSFRSKMLSSGIFYESGLFTLSVNVTEENLESVIQESRKIMEDITRLANAQD